MKQIQLDPSVDSNTIIKAIVESEKVDKPRAMFVMSDKKLDYISQLPPKDVIKALVLHKFGKPKSQEEVPKYEEEVKSFLQNIYKTIMIDTIAQFMDDDQINQLKKFLQ